MAHRLHRFQRERRGSRLRRGSARHRFSLRRASAGAARRGRLLGRSGGGRGPPSGSGGGRAARLDGPAWPGGQRSPGASRSAGARPFMPRRCRSPRPSRGCGPSRIQPSWPACRPRARIAGRGFDRHRADAATWSDRGSPPADSGRRHSRRRCIRPGLRHDRGIGSEQRASPCSADRPAVAARRSRDRRRRSGSGRLSQRHDPLVRPG